MQLRLITRVKTRNRTSLSKSRLKAIVSTCIAKSPREVYDYIVSEGKDKTRLPLITHSMIKDDWTYEGLKVNKQVFTEILEKCLKDRINEFVERKQSLTQYEEDDYIFDGKVQSGSIMDTLQSFHPQLRNMIEEGEISGIKLTCSVVEVTFDHSGKTFFLVVRYGKGFKMSKKVFVNNKLRKVSQFVPSFLCTIRENNRKGSIVLNGEYPVN